MIIFIDCYFRKIASEQTKHVWLCNNGETRKIQKKALKHLNNGKKEYVGIFGPELNSKLQNLKYFHMKMEEEKKKDEANNSYESLRLMLRKNHEERKLQKRSSPNDDDEVSFKFLLYF